MASSSGNPSYSQHDIGKQHCYYSKKHERYACIVLFGLRTGTDNIRDYAGLYTKDPFLALSLALCLLSLGGLPPLAGFFGKLHLFWCGWQAGLYFLVSIGLLTSVVSIYYYLKIIKLLMTGRNQEITPHVRNYRGSPLRSNNSIELSMIVCVIASTIPGISMNPIIEIAQDTLFQLLESISQFKIPLTNWNQRISRSVPPKMGMGQGYELIIYNLMIESIP